MVKTRDEIRATARQLLRDEFKTSGMDFEDDELDIHIGEVLIEISEKRPYEVKETLKTSNRSGTATSTSASHLVDTVNAQFTANDLGRTVYNSTDETTAKVTQYNSESDLTLDTDIMASGESYYIYNYGGTSGRDLDLSSIEDLLDIDKAEYRTRQSPKTFRNVKIFGDVLTLDVDSEPSDDEEVFLYCHKVHQLTESSSTLRPDLERVMVEGVVAKAALSWVNEIRTQISAAITTMDSIGTALSSIDARITQAVADLTSGRNYIAKKNADAITAIGSMTARITQAVNDLTSGRNIIGNKRTNAITAIDGMADYITQAVNDLTSGRAKIADERTAMDTAIDNMSDRITQAKNDLTSGRSLINKANIGQSPEDDYARYATTELGNAARYLDQAKGYLSEATTSDRYANYAARDLELAVSSLNKAKGYLATDQAATEYSNSAARELQSAANYLNQARGYLAVDQPAVEYGNYAARELANATGYLNKATGYSRKVTAQLNAAGAISRYQTWANNQIVIYQQSLKQITRPRVWKFYSRN